MRKWFRVCAGCSYSLPPVDLFCRTCWRHLENQRLLSEPFPIYPRPPFPVLPLWFWDPKKIEARDVGNILIERLIYSLKNSELPEAHRRLSYFFVQRLLCSSRFKPQVIFYPSKGPEDHASYLAKNLALLLRIDSHPLYIAKSPRAYRPLSRAERQAERRVTLHPISAGLRRSFKAKNLLFVDDVYTSGTTALRAWQSLGEPKAFQVAVLAYKGFETLSFPEGPERVDWVENFIHWVCKN